MILEVINNSFKW